ncbi:hypothetical protein M9Y10_038248 [Tritrichomonas musculus]|uniref:Uncharacterized protein n=1 Tax=Tritrichomonas musculus TaxID=1915356 RepID=A0ABR2KB26_9EUKA
MKKARSLLYPKGTYQTPPFFFRGGDEFKENEHLQSEYSAAKNDLKRAKKELLEARSEYEKVKSILDDKEGRAVALAETLGGTNTITTENAQYRRQIADLAVEIDELRYKISEARTHASISTIAAIDRERSSYFLTIENLQVKLQELKNNTQEKKLRLYEIFASPEWHERSRITCEFEITYRFHEYLQKFCKSSFEQQNFGDSNTQAPLKRTFDQSFFTTSSLLDNSSTATSMKSTMNKDNFNLQQQQIASQQNALQDLQQLINQRMQLDIQCQEIMRERYATQIRRRVSIASLLNDIEKLDYALQDLGEEEIGVDDLRRAFLPDGPFTPIKMRKHSSSLSMPPSVSSTSPPSSRMSTRRAFTSPTPTARNSRINSGAASSINSSRKGNKTDGGNSYFFGIQTISGSAKKSRKNRTNYIKTSSDNEKEPDAPPI